VQVRNVATGRHGIHVHEAAVCEPPDFSSAGAHFNPAGQPHHGEMAGHHAGDLPNLEVSPNGTGRLEAVLTGVTLRGRGHHSLFHIKGTSIVSHLDSDDGKSSPSGNSGDRIACGVIVPGDS
jgi:Cu-Zn family superoxide dismutase